MKKIFNQIFITNLLFITKNFSYNYLILQIKVSHIKMSQLELDPQFTQGLHLLHSTNKDSAEQLRALLDEAIKQKYGPSKMLSNVLHKKVIR